MSKKKKYIIFIILAILITIIGVTFAKYVTEDYHGYYTNAKDFSFSSSILKEDRYTTYEMNNWSGVGEFDLTFDLSSKKNNLYYANYDIPYTVSYNCPNSVECTIDKQSGTIYANNPTHTDVVTLHVRPLRSFNEGEMLEIDASAQSTSPYVKSLYASYRYVVTNKGVSYSISDTNRIYIIYTITNAVSYCTVKTAFGDYSVGDRIDISVYKTLSDADKAKCPSVHARLNFDPEQLIIDTTDNIITNNNYQTTTIDGTAYINQIEFDLEPASAIKIKFYKMIPGAYYYTGEGVIELSTDIK